MAKDIYQQGQQAKEEHKARSSESDLSASRHGDEKKIDDRFVAVQRLADIAEATRAKFAAALGRYNEVIIDFDMGNPARFASLLSIVFLSAIAALLIDYFWLGLSTEFILDLAGTDEDSLFAQLAKVAIPIVVIILEATLAGLIYTSYLKSKLRGMALFWGAFAVAFLVCLCLATASALIASSEADSIGEMDVWEILLMIAYTGLSSLPHVIILFSGRLGYEGKGLLYVMIRWRWAQWLNLRYDRRASATLAEFNRMERDIDTFDEKHHRSYRRGVFSKDARHIINTCAGVQLIPPPPGEPYGEDDTPGPTSSPLSPLTALRRERINAESH